MAFPDSVVTACWQKADRKCEKCGRTLVLENKGRVGFGCWADHHIDGNPNNDSITNCQILCWRCHEKACTT